MARILRKGQVLGFDPREVRQLCKWESSLSTRSFDDHPRVRFLNGFGGGMPIFYSAKAKDTAWLIRLMGERCDELKNLGIEIKVLINKYEIKKMETIEFA